MSNLNDYKPVPSALLAQMAERKNLYAGVDPLLCGYQRLLDKLRIPRKGVLHLGGHVGQELPMYAALAFQNVVMVEPLPDEYAQLQKRVDEFNLTCAMVSSFLEEAPMRAHAVRCAVTDQSGPCTLYRTGMTSLSSLSRPLSEHFSKLDLWSDRGGDLPWYKRPFLPLLKRQATSYREVGVAGKTLDQLVDELPHGWCAQDFSYLRLNIQGAELKALKGGASVLQHVRMIDLETNVVERYENAPQEAEFSALLSPLGFVRVFGYRVGAMGNLIYARLP